MGDLNSKDLCTQHQDFWFNDGSVVLVVEATSFKIHRTVLSRHSDVFAGMFTVPQPVMSDIMDACPVVRLQQDRASDFVDVLNALYTPFYFDSLSADADLTKLISFVSGILRFSTKYSMQVLRQKCLDLLGRKFPTTLAECDEILALQYQYKSSSLVEAIILARESNVPAILPWALYIITHVEIDVLLDHELLSWKDKAICVAGKERLWEAQKYITHPFLFDYVPAPSCRTHCQPLQQMGWRNVEALRVEPHPLQPYSEWLSFSVCSACVNSMKEQHQAGRERVWEMLPGLFGLGSWDEIQKEQNY